MEEGNLMDRIRILIQRDLEYYQVMLFIDNKALLLL